jgi:hypothetical protein
MSTYENVRRPAGHLCTATVSTYENVITSRHATPPRVQIFNYAKTPHATCAARLSVGPSPDPHIGSGERRGPRWGGGEHPHSSSAGALAAQLEKRSALDHPPANGAFSSEQRNGALTQKLQSTISLVHETHPNSLKRQTARPAPSVRLLSARDGAVRRAYEHVAERLSGPGELSWPRRRTQLRLLCAAARAACASAAA